VIQNNHTVRDSFLLLAISLFAAIAGTAQVRQPTASESAATGSIRGKVVLPSGAPLNERVKITLQTVRGLASIVYTDSQGQFEFTKLSPGSYQVLIEADRKRFEPVTDNVEVVRSYPSVLNIVFKEKSSSSKEKPTTISTGELDPSIPSKARKEFERGSKASKEGKIEEAITYFRKAIALYPQYLMAHNDLASQLMKLGMLDDAEDELREALSIDSSAFNPTLNLGIVLVKMHEFEEASSLLDKAISLQPRSASARLYSGLAMLGTSNVERAEKELKAAYDLDSRECVLALFHLGELYLTKGDRNLARAYLERYLHEAPQASNSDQVKKLIALLQ
jgi:tetratricopeptide (TPR) repeat protein